MSVCFGITLNLWKTSNFRNNFLLLNTQFAGYSHQRAAYNKLSHNCIAMWPPPHYIYAVGSVEIYIYEGLFLQELIENSFSKHDV